MDTDIYEISYDPAKRERCLRERGIDFKAAPAVFRRAVADEVDDRQDYGETRFITFGYLNERLVVVVWTPRGDVRHVISMRKANDKEQRRYASKAPPGVG